MKKNGGEKFVIGACMLRDRYSKCIVHDPKSSFGRDGSIPWCILNDSYVCLLKHHMVLRFLFLFLKRRKKKLPS